MYQRKKTTHTGKHEEKMRNRCLGYLTVPTPGNGGFPRRNFFQPATPLPSCQPPHIVINNTHHTPHHTHLTHPPTHVLPRRPPRRPRPLRAPSRPRQARTPSSARTSATPRARATSRRRRRPRPRPRATTTAPARARGGPRR